MAVDTISIREVGQIQEVRRDIAKVVGLNRCMVGETLDFGANAKGLVYGFDQESAFVFLLGRVEDVKIGCPVYSSMKPFTIPVGENFLGRIVNALAQPIDGKGKILSHVTGQVFRDAPGVMDRMPIKRSLSTGLLTVDSTIPIGRGQRELIIGDRMTGKTTIAIDTILNQKGKDVKCIYCCIGRSHSSLRRIVETLKINGAMAYTIVVAATASCCGGEQYIAPFTAAALGEYFMDRGQDVFVAFDDLTKHAWAYRQLSLLLERPPGRECYPGDIFYLHSQLMERAGQLNREKGGGSMTFFPIVDTLQGDVTGYIPSNLVSMTDGQIYMSANLFNSGFRPAIDLGLSVSRIGNKVQGAALRKLSGMLRLEYVQYNELLKKTRFSAGVSEEVAARLRPGQILTQLFTQDANSPYPLARELIFLYALRRKILEPYTHDQIQIFKREILEFAEPKCSGVIEALQRCEELSGEQRKELEDVIREFFDSL